MNRTQKILIATGSVAIICLAGAGTWWALYGQNDSASTQQTSSNQTANTSTAPESASLKNDVDWDSLPTTNVSLDSSGLTITEAGTYVLTGSTTGQIKVNSSGNVRIILDGATIKTASGPAIYIQQATKTVVQLASGSSNTIEDSTAADDASGVLYSSGDVIIEGDGSLTVNGKVENGIVASNLVITAGNLTLAVADKAIDITNTLMIDGGSINVTSSQEGLEAAQVVINNGTVKINASDDGINAASDDSSNIYIKITITGGDINVTVAAGDTDALDANGDIYVLGGNLTITAPTSSFDFDGTAEFTGGNITANGQKITKIENSMMPGGGATRR